MSIEDTIKEAEAALAKQAAEKAAAKAAAESDPPEPKEEPKPKAKAEPDEPAEPKETKKAKAPKEEPAEVDEATVDEAIEAGKQLPAMPVKAFMSRVRRATKQQLIDMFGTDDKDAILNWKREHDAYLKEKEERDRAAMTEKEKLEADLAKAKRQADDVKQQFDSYKEEREYVDADGGMAKIANRYVDEDAADYVVTKFAKHVASLDMDDEDDKAMYKAYKKDPDAIAGWFKDYVKKHPKFGRDSGTPEKKDEPKAKKEPANTAPPRKDEKPKAEKSGTPDGKTFRPGQTNSMDYEDIKKAGYSWR